MTDTKTIEEQNTMIHDFIGARRMKPPFEHWWVGAQKPEDLRYHLSWDWLMPIVEKIGKIELGRQENESTGEMMPYYAHVYTFRDNMTRIHCFPLHEGSTQIESTWKAVVDFIEWYKEQPPLKATKTAWIAAVDTDSFNYFPKQIEEKHFSKAIKESCALFDTVAQAQKECDKLNEQ